MRACVRAVYGVRCERVRERESESESEDEERVAHVKQNWRNWAGFDASRGDVFTMSPFRIVEMDLEVMGSTPIGDVPRALPRDRVSDSSSG